MLVTPDTFEAAIKLVADAPDVSVDLETTGLRPYHGDSLVGIAVSNGKWQMYFPFRHPETWNVEPWRLGPLIRCLGAASRGGHNFIRFDERMLLKEPFGQYDNASGQAWDTMIDATLVDENVESFKLETLTKLYCGGASKTAGNARLLDELRRRNPKLKAENELKGHIHELPAQTVAPYACGDANDAWRLRQYLRPRLDDNGGSVLAQENYAFAALLARMESRGLQINRQELERRMPAIESERAHRLEQIRRCAPNFNPQSPPQVCRLFGTEDAKAATLERLDNPLARSIVSYKRLGKIQSTYYEAILKALDKDDVLHPQFNLTRDPRDVGGTRTGRLSCSNPNFQNLPRSKADNPFDVRDLVQARPGMMLVKADYERAEMWLAGHYTQDRALLDAYTADRDLYQELAQSSKITRQEAKTCWLMIQYGAGVWKIAQTFGWPEQKAYDVKGWFGRLCPGIMAWMYDLGDRAEKTGRLRLWSGRIVHFDGAISKYFAAWNKLIQGGVGEMVRVAMQRLESPLIEVGAQMLLQVHDELVVETPADAVPRTVDLMREAMTDFPFRLRPRVEFAVGSDYGHCKSIDAAV